MSTPVERVTDDAGESPVPGLAALAREREPARDLWPGIEGRVAAHIARRRRHSPWPYALAASVCLALLTGLLLRREPVRSPAETLQVASIEDVAAHSDSDGLRRPYTNRDAQARMLSPRTVRMLRSESLDDAPALVAQRADGLMKATYSAAGTRGSHGQQAILRANLKLVVQAEREVRRALKADPESTSLQNLLEVAQEKRAALTALIVHEQD